MAAKRKPGPQLDRRQFLKAGLALGGAAGLGALLPATARAQTVTTSTAAASAGAAHTPGQRPNLLFVLTDQHSHDMLGCYGNSQIITPNLDRLAAGGVRFTQCVSSYPVCTACRSMLLSGQHVLLNGCVNNDFQMIPSTARNYLGEVLRDGGYRMGYIGKWHLYGGSDHKRPVPAGPLRYGWDEHFLTNNCTLDYRPGHAYFWNEKGEQEIYPEWEVDGQARQALEFLDGCTPERPFALVVAWHPPHDHYVDGKRVGYDAPEHLMAMYQRDQLRLRPNTSEAVNREYFRLNPPEKRYCGQSGDVRADYHGYYAMVTGVDQAFGRIMEKLRARGLADNTIVVFSSDHGCGLGAWSADIQDIMQREGVALTQAIPKMQPTTKGVPHDWSTRVPLIIQWPARLKPQVSELPVGTLDFMPTLLGLLGLPVPATCQGSNLAGLLTEGTGTAPESVPLFSHWFRGVYTPRYTYALSGPRNGWLWDRQSDPWQMKNLFHAPEHAALRKELHQLTLRHMALIGDRFPTSQALLARTLGAGSDAPQEVAKLIKAGGIPQGRPVDLLRTAPSVLPELG